MRKMSQPPYREFDTPTRGRGNPDKWDVFLQHSLAVCGEPLPPKPDICNMKANQTEVGWPLRGRNYCVPATQPDCDED